MFPQAEADRLDLQTSLFTAGYNLRVARDENASAALFEEMSHFIAAIRAMESAVRADDFNDFVDASMRYSESLAVLEGGCERIGA